MNDKELIHEQYKRVLVEADEELGYNNSMKKVENDSQEIVFGVFNNNDQLVSIYKNEEMASKACDELNLPKASRYRSTLGVTDPDKIKAMLAENGAYYKEFILR